MDKNYFQVLNEINVNDKTEKKNGLTYLSWAWAWGEIKKLHPDSAYTIYENSQGWNYHSDGKTAWVKTGVTVNGIEHIEYLPVMDHKNNSIPVERITSFDVNKAIQRSLTKACARHGLGLYIYAGEDLPDGSEDATAQKREPQKKEPPKEKPIAGICEVCGAGITDHVSKTGVVTPAHKVMEGSYKMFGKRMCGKCLLNANAKANEAAKAAPAPEAPADLPEQTEMTA